MKIFKYDLGTGHPNFTAEVSMPKDSTVRSVGMQGGKIIVWASVSDCVPTVRHSFRILGTGIPHILPSSAKFVGTVFDGPFVWHVFDLGEQ